MPSFFSSRLGSRLLAAAAAALLAGCQSSDLSKDAVVNGEVAECLPPGTPAPQVVARAIWFPNASGFGSTDASPVGHVSGVLALAGDRLWFMAWNDPEHHYDMLHVVAVLPAEGVRLSHLGTAAMLVIQSSNDIDDAYELMNGGQVTSDPAATEDLFRRIQALRARSPQTDP